MNCRKNVKDLTPGEKAAYVQAVIDLKNSAPSLIPAAQLAGGQGRYDDYVWIHNEVGGGAHRGPAFGPWHRELLYQFERDLQAVSGDPNMRVPYWDWTTARTPSDDGWPFTADFMGSLGASATDARVTTSRFATDPLNPGASEWVINIPDVETGNYLKRRGGLEPSPLPTASTVQTLLGITTYDAAPWQEAPGSVPTSAQLLASFRKFLEYALHNGPHPWVGGGYSQPINLIGSMSFAASPNDPIFFLHHANIDRLWAIWQQRYGYPGYLPQSGAGAGHDGPDNMAFINPAYFSYAPHQTPNSNEEHKTMGFRYDSDLPDISLVSASVNFGNVPQGLTTYKPVQFTIETCRPVNFRITAVGGAGFSVPAIFAGPTIVNPDPNTPSVTGDVYIQYEATTGTGVSVPGTATIEAYINDTDGYYISPADPAFPEYVLGSWPVSLIATPIPKPNSAVSLVLDRSGSMSLSAGGTTTRFQLLKNAVEVMADLMESTDGLGMVYFDHTIDPVFGITAMTPAGGQTAVANALANPVYNPNGGSTAIGNGMISGAGMINVEMGSPGTPYEQFAMIVMTDGNENVTPYSNHPTVSAAISGFSNRVYAVGLGQEGDVSDATLGSIANYMLITGDMTPAEQEFRLTKYFVQLLAGITNMAIVVDPQGELVIGAEHTIPFTVTEADVRIDVIALSPLAFLLDMRLIAPDGTVIDPSTASPNIEYHVNRQDLFYRLMLPALPGQDGTHAGEWTAVLTIAKGNIRERLARWHEERPILLESRQRNALPYSFLVQSYSNINMDVQVEQTNKLVGSPVDLYATLSQYNVPLENQGQVRVEITTPSRAVDYVWLKEYAPGRFKGQYHTTVAGTYHCRFVAKGHSFEGTPFTREQLRSVPAYRQLPTVPPPTQEPRPDDNRRDWCRLVACLLKVPGVREYLEEHGIEMEALARCLKAFCEADGRHAAAASTATTVQPVLETAVQHEVARHVLSLVRNARQLGMAHLPEPRPVPPLDIPEPPPMPGDMPMRMIPVVQNKDGEWVPVPMERDDEDEYDDNGHEHEEKK